jgi:hypothetical protein
MSSNVGVPRALTPLSVRKAVGTRGGISQASAFLKLRLPLFAPLPFVTKSSYFSHQIILVARLGSPPQTP